MAFKKKKRISLSLSLSLSLSGQNNEGSCDDGFVDVKSVEVSGIGEKGPFYSAGRPRWPLCEFLSHIENWFLLQPWRCPF